MRQGEREWQGAGTNGPVFILLELHHNFVGRHLKKDRQLLQNGAPVRESYLPLQRPSI